MMSPPHTTTSVAALTARTQCNSAPAVRPEAIRVESISEAPAARQLPAGIRPAAWRVPDACRLMGISKTTLYELVKRGEIRTKKLGRVTHVTDAEINRVLGTPREAV